MGGAHRLTAFLLASCVAHAAVLVGVTEMPTIDVTTHGETNAISVRLVPAGSGGYAESAAQGVAAAVPRAAAQPASEPATAANEQADNTDARPSDADGSSEGNAVSARTAAATEPAERAEPAGEPDSAVPPRPERSAAASDDARGTSGARQRLARTTEVATTGGDGGDAERRQLAQRARTAVERELAQHFRYPRLARQRGWQGRVVLAFRIDADGHIDGVRVRKSSGRAILDETAVESLRSIERLPGMAEHLGSGSFDLTLPVTYQLEPG